MAEYQEDLNVLYRKYQNHHQFKNGDIDAGVGRTLGSVSVGFISKYKKPINLYFYSKTLTFVKNIAMTAEIRSPFTNLQMEMIQLFSKEIPEPQLLEIRTMIAKYLLEKACDAADAAWDRKGYTQTTIEQLLNHNAQ